jgi:hypothetical protein
VKEIYKLGLKHGARLSEIRGPNGILTEDDIDNCRRLAEERLKSWRPRPVVSVTPKKAVARRS